MLNLDAELTSALDVEERRLRFKLDFIRGKRPIEMRRSHIIEDMVEYYNSVEQLTWQSFVFKDEDGAGLLF